MTEIEVFSRADPNELFTKVLKKAYNSKPMQTTRHVRFPIVNKHPILDPSNIQ